MSACTITLGLQPLPGTKDSSACLQADPVAVTAEQMNHGAPDTECRSRTHREFALPWENGGNSSPVSQADPDDRLTAEVLDKLNNAAERAISDDRQRMRANAKRDSVAPRQASCGHISTRSAASRNQQVAI